MIKEMNREGPQSLIAIRDKITFRKPQRGPRSPAGIVSLVIRGTVVGVKWKMGKFTMLTQLTSGQRGAGGSDGANDVSSGGMSRGKGGKESSMIVSPSPSSAPLLSA
jgi:hypothetical protein